MAMLSRLFVVAVVFFSSAVLAQTNPAPYTLINQVGNELFADIKAVNAQGKATNAQMRQIVKTHLMPHMDVKFISFKLLGSHIKTINKEQAVSFIDAVSHYLEVTYADALMQYQGQDIHYIKPNANPEGDYAMVRTELKESGKPDIQIDFKFRQDNKGQWKVYDLVAEGISLLSAKQKEVVVRISEVGIDAATNELKKKA